MATFTAPVATRYSGNWGRYPVSGRLHLAVDYPSPRGTIVRATQGGVVKKSGWSTSGFGNHVRILLDDGNSVIYGHLLTIRVKNGVRVKRGQAIGTVDSTGNSTGNHVHMEVRKKMYEPKTSWNFTPYLRPYKP
jgi:murein DD-endopeptidase MepM/ murein hydrolase activator NlpD